VNAERITRGLNRLEFDDTLRDVARYHSRDMAVRNYRAHISPTGETMQDRYAKFGIDRQIPIGDSRYATGGENIFYRSTSSIQQSVEEFANQIVEGWLESPRHRRNLLRECWQQEGIGVYISSGDRKVRFFVTQNFG
jgi:uncharacterized protein YkwD